MPSMPDIKLTRTDTTHDLSQKAEKRCQRTNCTNMWFIDGTLCRRLNLSMVMSVLNY